MTNLSFLDSIPLFYVSPDIKRALGLEGELANFAIICTQKSRLVDLVRNSGCIVFCLEEEIGKDAAVYTNTGKLLEHQSVNTFIQKNVRGLTPHILYFKPNLKVDLLCEKLHYKKLMNPYNLNEEFENKINFYEKIKALLPQNTIPGRIGKLKTISNNLIQDLGYPLVVQFGHGWAGKTTFMIQNKQDLLSLQEKYPHTTVKITKYIKGHTILNNCCIYDGKVLIGQPALQLSGFPELSENEFVTCGRQWPAKSLTSEQDQTIRNTSEVIGKLMMQTGYKGYFGLDYIIQQDSEKVYLSENNARFTASTPFFTKRELQQQKTPLIAYHIASFLNKQNLPPYENPEIKGSQLIIRTTQKKDIGKNDIRPGIYEWRQNTLAYKKEGYDINQTRENEFVFIPKQQRGNKKDEEIGRIETNETVTTKPNVLNQRYKQIIKAVVH